MTMATLKLNSAKPKAKTRRKEMTDVEKGMIIAFYYCFGCIQTVAGLVARPWSTVKSFLVRTILRLGNQENLPRSRRPTLLNQQQRRMIVKAAKSNRTMNRTDFRDKFAPGISLTTVDRVLREANIKKWLAKKRPLLKPDHVKKRLSWAMARQDWTIEDFMGVIWSDECNVEKSKDPRQIWVFREPWEKWLADCVHPKPKDRGISLMVWGCFHGRTKGPLVPIPESVTGLRYLRLIKRHLPRVIRSALEINSSCSFQQDNAPVHKAGIVMDWLENNNIDLENHPLYSPDINPIEHVWVELK